MIRARKKSIALITALVFMLTIVAPMAAFAANDDNTVFSSASRYISTGSDKEAGSISVKSAAYWDKEVGEADSVVVRAELPDGVTFSDSKNVYVAVAPAGKVVTRSSFVEVTYDYNNEWKPGVGFFELNFVEDPVSSGDPYDNRIDVDSDFSGDLKVAVTVTGLNGDDVVFEDWDDLLIARVTGADISVTADDAKTVSMGNDKELAEITIKESQAGALGKGSVVRFDIMTKGVEFVEDVYTVNANATDNPWGALRMDIALDGEKANNKKYEDNDRIDIEVTKASEGLPGAITFTPFVSIDPSASGEIKIRVSSDDKDLKSTTLVVGKIGDVTGVIEEVEDNDTVVYAGSRGTELDVSFEINTVSDDNFGKGDVISLTLNNGKFARAPNADWKLYNSDKSIYYTVGDSEDSVVINSGELVVKCDNDVEEGDIVLTAGGNAGVEGEVVIGQFAKPFTVTADTPNILSEALNQAAGNIVITEVDAEALAPFEDVYVDGELVNVEKTAVFFELPSGIELKGTPKVDVTEGNIDVDIEVVDDNIIALIIEGDSSDASTIEISGIRYDTGRLALTGPVELEAYFAYYAEGEWETVDGVLCTVANAIVGDQNTVTASFTVGDEGVAIVNGRTLVQVNLLCDVLGLQKSWDAAEKTAYFVKDGKVVAFPMGENAVYINGVKVPMDQGGMIINDFTYATLRGLEAAFGGTLDWDNDTKTATFVFNK